MRTALPTTRAAWTPGGAPRGAGGAEGRGVPAAATAGISLGRRRRAGPRRLSFSAEGARPRPEGPAGEQRLTGQSADLFHDMIRGNSRQGGRERKLLPDHGMDEGKRRDRAPGPLVPGWCTQRSVYGKLRGNPRWGHVRVGGRPGRLGPGTCSAGPSPAPRSEVITGSMPVLLPRGATSAPSAPRMGRPTPRRGPDGAPGSSGDGGPVHRRPDAKGMAAPASGHVTACAKARLRECGAGLRRQTTRGAGGRTGLTDRGDA